MSTIEEAEKGLVLPATPAPSCKSNRTQDQADTGPQGIDSQANTAPEDASAANANPSNPPKTPSEYGRPPRAGIGCCVGSLMALCVLLVLVWLFFMAHGPFLVPSTNAEGGNRTTNWSNGTSPANE